MRLCWSHIPHCWKTHVVANFHYVICFIQGSQLLDQFGKLDVDPEQFVLYKPFNGTLDNMTITEGQK